MLAKYGSQARFFRRCWRNAEHIKLLLHDDDGLELLANAATFLARAHVPQAFAPAVALARMTPLRKPFGGVRGIATGDAFCRIVARTLANEWAPVFDAAMRLFQYALQARAGTDALANQVRAALELLDGRSAYDTISTRFVPHSLAGRGARAAAVRAAVLRAALDVLLVGCRGVLPGHPARRRL